MAEKEKALRDLTENYKLICEKHFKAGEFEQLQNEIKRFKFDALQAGATSAEALVALQRLLKESGINANVEKTSTLQEDIIELATKLSREKNSAKAAELHSLLQKAVDTYKIARRLRDSKVSDDIIKAELRKLFAQTPAEVNLGSSPEKTGKEKEVQIIENTVAQCLSLVNAGRHQEVGPLLSALGRNKDVHIQVTSRILILTGNLDQDVSSMAGASWHSKDGIILGKHGLGTATDKKPDNYSQENWNKLQRETALVHIEEFSHWLQDAKNGQLSKTDLSKAAPSDRKELDVAAFFLEQKVDLKGTYFIKRYGRDQLLKN